MQTKPKNIAVFIAISAILLLTITACGQSDTSTREFIESYIGSIRFDDPTSAYRLESFYAPDVRAILSDGNSIQGKENILRAFEAGFEKSASALENISLESKILDVNVHGNIAVGLVRFQITGRLKNDGSPFERQTWLTLVMEKTAGKWAIIHEHASLAVKDTVTGSRTRLTPDETKQAELNIEGVFSGIGVEINSIPDGIIIKRVIAGGSAEKAGIKQGYIINAINGKSTKGMSTPDAVVLLRGPAGSEVLLQTTDTAGNRQQIAVQRTRIVVPGVESRSLDNGLWLVKLTDLNKQTPQSFKTEIQAILQKNPKGLILDIRGNASGYYSVVVETAAMFLPKGRIMWFIKPTSGETQAVRTNNIQVVTLPMVVLVDANTRGLELVAAAMKRNNRAKILGQKTSGLSAQRTLDKQEDGSSEKFIVGTFYYTQQIPITGKGIEPDIAIDPALGEQIVISKATEALLAQIAGQT